MSVINVSVSGGTGSTTTATSGDTIDVAVGNLTAGTLPALQLAAGNGIAISYANGVSTISANTAEFSLVANLGDLSDVSNASATTGQALIWNGTEWAGGNQTAGTFINGLSGNVTLSGEGLVGVSVDGQNITLGSALSAEDVEYPISSEGQTLNVFRDESLKSTTVDVNWPSTPFGVSAISDSSGNVTVYWQEPIPRAGQYVVEYEKIVALSAPEITSATVSGGDLDAAVLYDQNPTATDNELQYSLDGGTTWEQA